jgi:hypothetical protein
MGKPKETKILLVLGLQDSLCRDPRFADTKARVIKQIRRYVLDSISYHKKKRHVLLLNNPNVEHPENPEDLLDILGTKPERRQQAFKKLEAATLSCPTPDPFLGTNLEPILSFLTRSKSHYSMEICGFGYDRIWLTAMSCAIRGYKVTILSDLVGSYWAYEFQEEDRLHNRNIVIKKSGKEPDTMGGPATKSNLVSQVCPKCRMSSSFASSIPEAQWECAYCEIQDDEGNDTESSSPERHSQQTQ